jgi:hypothetical protein
MKPSTSSTDPLSAAPVGTTQNSTTTTGNDTSKSSTPSSILTSARSFLVGIDSRVSQLMPVYRNKHGDLLRSTTGTGVQHQLASSQPSGQRMSSGPFPSSSSSSSSDVTRSSRTTLGSAPITKPNDTYHR